MSRILVAALLAAVLATPALAKDRRPGQADPDVSWEKQAQQKDCGRAVSSADAQTAKGRHGQAASTEGTIPCPSSAGTASPPTGKSGRNEPGRN